MGLSSRPLASTLELKRVLSGIGGERKTAGKADHVVSGQGREATTVAVSRPAGIMEELKGRVLQTWFESRGSGRARYHTYRRTRKQKEPGLGPKSPPTKNKGETKTISLRIKGAKNNLLISGSNPGGVGGGWVWGGGGWGGWVGWVVGVLFFVVGGVVGLVGWGFGWGLVVGCLWGFGVFGFGGGLVWGNRIDALGGGVGKAQ